MKVIPPGYTLKGIICKACSKSWSKNKTYCSRPEHHKSRPLKINKKVLEKVSKIKNDYNYCELIAAICLKFPNITKKEDIIYYADQIACIEKDSYLENLERRTPKNILNYIQYVNSIRHHFPQIQEVIVIGKSMSQYPVLSRLNQGLDQKQSKADLMLVDIHNRWIGISIKASPYSYLSNYSLEKMLPNGEALSKIKLDYLIDSGYPSFKKSERDELNELFYPKPHQPNPYWEEVMRSMEINKNEIMSSLLNLLTSNDTPYPMYEMNGKSLVDLKRGLRNKLLNETHILKMELTEKRRAKLVYYIVSNNIKNYRVEIRWKGNVFQSPQLMMQKV